MPKGGTVTFEIEPLAVLKAAGWLLDYQPYGAHASGLMLAALTPEELEAKAELWQRQVAEVTKQLLGWVRRRKRIERYTEPMPLCLDRELVVWLGNYAPSASGGLFGSSSRKPPRLLAPKDPAAEHFFRACRKATTRPMGRPKLSRAVVAERLVDTEKLSSTTLWRMLKIDEQRLPDITGLLATIGKKTP
jgi:hypothetical protein